MYVAFSNLKPKPFNKIHKSKDTRLKVAIYIQEYGPTHVIGYLKCNIKMTNNCILIFNVFMLEMITSAVYNVYIDKRCHNIILEIHFTVFLFKYHILKLVW